MVLPIFGINELGTAVHGAWVCNQLFSFNGDDITSCTWISDTCVQLIFCGDDLCAQIMDREALVLLEPQDSVILKSSVLKSACRPGTLCSINKFANRTSIVVSAPLFPLQPDVFIAASDAGGACDSPLTLDASATSGSGGRPWKKIIWSVTLPDTTTAATASAAQASEFDTIANFLNSKESISSPITIPFDMLNSSNYKFTLTVANFLQVDASDFSSASVDAVITDAASASIPFVYFDGSFYRTVRAFDEFTVVASSILPTCISSSVVTYSWKAYKELTYAPGIQSLSTDARKMRLDPYTLEAGQTYTFLVTANVDNGGVGSAILTVFVELGSVYVSIAGASALVIPHASQLSLDASGSVLEDLSPFDSNNIVQLSWSCSISAIFSNETDKVYGDQCDDILALNVSSSETSPSTELVPVFTSLLEPHVEYSVTASTVTAAGDEVSAVVTIQSLPPLVILPTLSITSTFRKFIANRILQIFSIVESPLNAVPQNISWQLYDDSNSLLELETYLLTSNTKVVQPNSTYSFPLSAKPYSFTPGKTYQFRLQALSPSSDMTFSQITLTANGPPTSGQFEVIPDVGTAMDTAFFFNAPYWMEDASDYPILYYFRYTLQLPSSNSSGVNFMNIGFSSQRSFRTSQLPSGSTVLNYTVFASVLISDFYGSSTDVAINISVHENPADLATRRRLSFSVNLSNTLDNAMSTGDVDEVSSEINNAIGTLALADCKSMPDCGQLYNRVDCFETPHTCGECIQGYIGVAGAANSWCSNEDDQTEADFNTTNCTVVNGVDSCPLPLVCADTECVIPSQSCPTATTLNETCSGNGECLFYDSFTGLPLQNCSFNDTACVARCSCYDEYYGSACSFSGVEYEDRLSTRELLCKGLVYVGDNQDESTELMTLMTVGLRLAFNPYEVKSIDSLEACLHALRFIVNMSDHGYLPNEPFYGTDGAVPPQQAILELVSNMLEYFMLAERNRVDNNDTNVNLEMALVDMTSLIDSLVKSVSSNMVGGESDVEIITNNYRITVKYISMEDLLNATLYPPQTSSDIKGGNDGPFITLPATGMKACEALVPDGATSIDAEFVRLSVSSWQSNPYISSLDNTLGDNETLASGILRFASVGSSSQSSSEGVDGTDYDTNYTLTLQWNTEQEWNNTDNFPGIVGFLPDGSKTDAPCQLRVATSKSVSFTCFNLLDLCPQQAISNATNVRRLEMVNSHESSEMLRVFRNKSLYNFRFDEFDLASAGDGLFASSNELPAFYPDHPHYAYWSNILQQRNINRRLDFDYGGESDDDMSGTVTFADYGALVTSVGVEVGDNLKSNPAVFTTSQGIYALLGLGIAFGLFFVRLYYFIIWDRKDRQMKYMVRDRYQDDSVKVGKRTALILSTRKLDCDSDVDDDAAETVNRLNTYKSLTTDDNPCSLASEDDSDVSSHSFHDNTTYRRSLRVAARKSVDKLKSTGDLIGKFVEFNIPSVFARSNKSGWQRFMAAVYRHHNFVRCFTFPSRRLPRSIRFLIVAYEILIIMFVDSLFFGIMFVDDGYCESLSGEGNLEICEDRSSNMQSGISMCYFDKESYKCALRPPPSDITFFLIVSMLVTLFSILPTLFCEYLFERICARTPSFAQKSLSDSKLIMNLGELRRSANESILSYISRMIGSDERKTLSRRASWLKSDMAEDIPDHISWKELRNVEIQAYLDSCVLEDEVNQVIAAAKDSIEYKVSTRALPWEVGNLSTDDGVHRAEALKNIIGLYDDGAPVPLTTLQVLVFGNARKRLEWKMRKVRKQVNDMMEDIDVFLRSDQDCVENINSYLIQSFILEQLSPFRRYAIMQEFFHFDDANPVPIDGISWVCCWIFLILFFLFLSYWVLLWAVQNSRVTAVSWTLQIIFVLMQELCVNENVQVLLMHVIVVETLRDQVKRIVDVLTAVLVSKVGTPGQASLQKHDEAKTVDFNVAQHMSASCRVAHKPVLCNLVASKILTQLDDHDIAMCRAARSSRIAAWMKMLITIPTLLALSHETVQECFLDVLIPTMWCCFVLSNAYLWELSPILFFAPYAFFILFVLVRYGYIIPARRRRRQYLKSIMEQNKTTEANGAAGYEEHADTVENMWRNMNLSLTLKHKLDSVPDTLSVSSNDVDNEKCFGKVNRPWLSSGGSFTPLSIPEEIGTQKVQLSAADKHLYNKTKKGKKKYDRVLNKYLWKIDSASMPTLHDGSNDLFSDEESSLDSPWDITPSNVSDRDSFNLFREESMVLQDARKIWQETTDGSVGELIPDDIVVPPRPRKFVKGQSARSIEESRPGRTRSEKELSKLPHTLPRSYTSAEPPADHLYPRTSRYLKGSKSEQRFLQPMRSFARMQSSTTFARPPSAPDIDNRLMALSSSYQSKRKVTVDEGDDMCIPETRRRILQPSGSMTRTKSSPFCSSSHQSTSMRSSNHHFVDDEPLHDAKMLSSRQQISLHSTNYGGNSLREASGERKNTVGATFQEGTETSNDGHIVVVRMDADSSTHVEGEERSDTTLSSLCTNDFGTKRSNPSPPDLFSARGNADDDEPSFRTTSNTGSSQSNVDEDDDVCMVKSDFVPPATKELYRDPSSLHAEFVDHSDSDKASSPHFHDHISTSLSYACASTELSRHQVGLISTDCTSEKDDKEYQHDDSSMTLMETIGLEDTNKGNSDFVQPQPSRYELENVLIPRGSVRRLAELFERKASNSSVETQSPSAEERHGKNV